MQAIIHPSTLKGTIIAPASKSVMQRACAAALVKQGTSILHNPGNSNDDKAALEIIQHLGAVVEKLGNGALKIHSKGVQAISPFIHCGESGLSIRMFTPLACLTNQQISIEGSGSLAGRPMNFFDEILPQLNVDIITKQGKLPLTVKGPLIPKNITVDGSLSSQFLTGLLMAYAAVNASDVTIQVNNLKSKPYIDLTLAVMQQFGLKLPQNIEYKQFYFPTENEKPVNKTVEYTVEGDWSGGAFLLVAAAINGNIHIKGLNVQSTQADKTILQALEKAGVRALIDAERIEINSTPLQAFQFNATDCPDLFPPLVALAAHCKGTTILTGIHRLTHKESNRALTLQQEFGKLGIEIQLQDDEMMVTGGEMTGGQVSSHHDHRIAMACAVAALKATDKVTIEIAEAINKSYPDFYKHLQQLRAFVSLEQ